MEVDVEHKVLLIHSDTNVQNDFVQAFAQAGVQLASASGFDQAMAKIDNEKFDAIFCDSRTIGTHSDSLETRVHRSQENGKAPIIVLCENEADSVRAHPDTSEDTYVLYKPFDAQQLLSVLSASNARIPRAQRKHDRMTVRMQVRVDTQHEQFVGLADSLSEGGMNLLVSGDVTLDTEWVVSFTLPGNVELIEASGRVRRTNEANVALSFEKIRDESRALIRRFVAAKKLIS
jgi:DNA-binding NtrC family response regulator